MMQKIQHLPISTFSYLLIALLLTLLLLPACIPPPQFPEPTGCESGTYRGVFILNEGVWTQNNASLDVWQDTAFCPAAFRRANGQPLGDVANSALLDGDTLFVVVNNSKLVYKLQLPEMKLLGQLALPPESAPREMLRIAPDKAFLTSFHTESLYAFNPLSMEMRAGLKVANSQEGILQAEEKVFVACGSHPFDGPNNQLAIIDAASQRVSYLDLPVENPGDLLLFEGKVLVSCRGNFDPSGPGGALLVVDAASARIERSIPFSGSLFDLELVGSSLLAIRDSSIARIDLGSFEVEANYLPKSLFTPDSRDLIYSLAYDEGTGELYVGIAPFGAVDGEVVVLDPFLREVRRLKVGLYPGQVLFYE
jgi:hypothetical protein